MSRWYILDAEKNPVPASVFEHAKWVTEHGFEATQRVASAELPGYDVSTVFLGLDHSFDAGPPLVFETMVFARGKTRGNDLWQDRYHTWDEALAGHRALVKRIMDGDLPWEEDDA